MAFVNKVTVAFPRSPSPDVDHYRLRVLPHDAPLEDLVVRGTFYSDYPYSVILSTEENTDDEGVIREELQNLEVAAGVEGVVDICITAVDGVGNESVPMLIDDAELDFETPQPPGVGWIER